MDVHALTSKMCFLALTFRFTYRAAHTVDLWPHVSAVGLRDAAHDVRQAEPHGRPDDDT